MATTNAPRKPRKEPMSRVDTAWLRMERPTNPMMITGVMMFDEPMTIERLREVSRNASSPIRASGRRRWIRPPAHPGWKTRISTWTCMCASPRCRDAATGNARRRPRALRQPAGVLAAGQVEATLAIPPDREVRQRLGLVARIHHCYADGMALVQVMLSMTDTAPQAGEEQRPARRMAEKRGANGNAASAPSTAT